MQVNFLRVILYMECKHEFNVLTDLFRKYKLHVTKSLLFPCFIKLINARNFDNTFS